METKYYSIRGTLARCYKEDFLRNGKIIENATYYIKDESTFQFKGRYVINSIYYNEVTPGDDLLTEKYYLDQIDYLVSRSLVFKLQENYDSLKFNFNLYLQTATEFDVFYGSTNHMILNTTYYCITPQNQILGPFMIKENHSGEKFREWLVKGLLLVPTKKQTFEPFKIAAAS
ncbi:hypothetical protein [Flavobacterium sp.]|uniref:hypothetical protein n=1 Tax=Flavobacterium sp. TaxID=239 RepID=UPI0026046341|nr:hypothetical protein [Flavobacterium sp.]